MSPSVEDITSPWNVPLAAKYMRSFAFVTIRDRLPVILTKVIDGLSRDKEAITSDYGEEGREDSKNVIGYLSKLKNEMVTDKCFTELKHGIDASIWNEHLQKKSESDTVSWYKTEWLYAECYLYRRIKEAFLTSKTLKEYDPFEKQKLDCLEESLKSMDILVNYLINVTKSCDVRWEANDYAFHRMLKHVLWANKVDLSISGGDHVEVKSNPLKVVDELDKFILVDDSKKMWSEVFESSKDKDFIIDVVLDNAGLEVMTDMCLAEYLTAVYSPRQVRFHCKAMPWFVSDVMEKDFHKTIERLTRHTSTCQQLATKWKRYLEEGKWSIHSEVFWTLPYGYSEMQQVDPKLYETLSGSSIIIFKGDLNYRKLLGDINWTYSTPFHAALRDFHPAPVLAIRTAKADLVAGVEPSVYQPVMATSPNWLITGDYGLIQFDNATSKEQVTANGS